MKKLSLKSIWAISAIMLAGAFGLTGCAQDGSGMNKTTIGAIAGAIGGAVIGKNVGDKDNKSAAIGAVLGGLAGGGVGMYMDKQQRELEEKLAKEQADKKIAIERMANNVIKVNLDSNSTFAVGKSNINPDFNASLKKIADTLKTNDKTAVHVVGYTDATGGDAANQVLSEQRAQSVQSFLIQNGVVADRTRTLGLGKSHPVADNNSEAGRKQNRRVEIYLKPIVEGQEQQAFVSPIN